MVTAFTFIASVVETGLGYLDEPIYLSFPDILTADDMVGRATPRMILSHASGIAVGNRFDPENDPYYVCKYDASKTFTECLKEFVLTDEVLLFEPGTQNNYSNEQWDILAELMARKTGLNNMGEVFKKYVADPIGMSSTSLDCPSVRSTSEKPHPSWGFCSTANDMAKLVQVLANKGSMKDGTQVMSERNAQQIFTNGAGSAVNYGKTSPLGIPQALTRCYGDFDIEDPVLDSIVGYGLGTFFMLGPKGDWFVHLGKTTDEIPAI